MLPRHSRTCPSSVKLFWTFWQSRRLLKIIEKYFEACKTFQDLSNFRKVILDLQAIQETFENHRNIFWSLQDISGLVLKVLNIFWSSTIHDKLLKSPLGFVSLFDFHCGLYESLCGPSGNPVDFPKSLKVMNPARHSRTCQTSGQLF